jgi:hypothetical protein
MGSTLPTWVQELERGRRRELDECPQLQMTPEEEAQAQAGLQRIREHPDELRAVWELNERYVAEREAALSPTERDDRARQRAREGRLPMSGVPMIRSSGGPYRAADPANLTRSQRRSMAAYRSEHLKCVRTGAQVPRATARPRGAGRPALKGASRRSSARSGDSDSEGEPEPPSFARICAGCGGDISDRRAGALTCGPGCRSRLARGRAIDGQPPPEADRPISLILKEATVARMTEPQAAHLLATTMGLRHCSNHAVIHPEADGCPQCAHICRALLEANGISAHAGHVIAVIA